MTGEERNKVIEFFKENKTPHGDDNIILYKELIKKKLLEYQHQLIYALHNTELERIDADISSYFGENIRPALIIPNAQTKPLNYLCYKVGFKETVNANKILRYTLITFNILIEQRELIDKKTSIARHDMLQNIVVRAFNWSNLFGLQCKLISNEEGLSDGDFVTRTLIFELVDTNAITRNGSVYNNAR